MNKPLATLTKKKREFSKIVNDRGDITTDTTERIKRDYYK